MGRIKVSSSNIASIGYEPNSRVLEIEFINGAVYQYSDVPKLVYEGLMAASSHGSFLDKNIKKAGYLYRRIG
ncbi:KTSC domain-containing protein [Nodosilinea sp. LEGE 07088]|uniref:KTSC domain-containing protein n=1 Tax=Nodosilinea sp. LEGE 07088 TaxID=2777968 RepID=UPI001882DCC0|nr:KTSC domain-containing protein [Nodosilinea sp. LEGE 07088]MBE9140925.1 KTSC domain-containing protein [Nodosilinea sp. LEGE 07088]